MVNEEKSKLTLNIPPTTDLPSTSGSHSAPVAPQTKSPKTATNVKLEMDLNTLLKFIKPYDGEREKLNSFIVNCNNAYELATDTQRPVLFKYILCQLQGKAEIACSIKNFTTWDQLKEFLKTQFSERKHYSYLLTDLQEIKQGIQETVSEFALKVETALSKLLMEISLSDTKVKEVAGRVASMEDLALHHFLMGLLPRLSNIVRCRSPKNLNEAINLAISEERIQQTMYRKNNNLNGSKPRPIIQNPNYNNNYSNNARQNQFMANRGPQRPMANSNNFQRPMSTSNNFQPGPSGSGSAPICRYCKTPGHDISVCRKREYNNNRFRAPQNLGPPPRVNFVTDLGEDVTDNHEAELSPDIPSDDLNE